MAQFYADVQYVFHSTRNFFHAKFRPMKRRQEGLAKAINLAGGVTTLAEKLGITVSALSRWTQVPIKRAIQVERITGVPRRELRPDYFDTTGS